MSMTVPFTAAKLPRRSCRCRASGPETVFVDTFRPQFDNQIALIGRL
jgi:hypothetical protein